MNLAELKVFFAQKREFLMTLLGNPSLLEHDHFTDLLWAVTHLDEELESRDSVENLPEADLVHLAGDIESFTAASWWNGWITSNTCTPITASFIRWCSAPIPSRTILQR